MASGARFRSGLAGLLRGAACAAGCALLLLALVACEGSSRAGSAGTGAPGAGAGGAPSEGGAGGTGPEGARLDAREAGPKGPLLAVLGSVQDGGLPHAGCSCTSCEAARRDGSRHRLVASLGLVIPGDSPVAPHDVYLIDATPDLTEQLALLRPYRERRPSGRVDRSPLTGIFLTHAHIGHYLGLAQLGFEVMHTRDVPVYATPRMASFLETNGPWSQLVELRNIDLRPTEPGTPVEVGAGVSVTALRVPHRDEFSDTVAYVIRGPRAGVLYVPDTDSWDAWPEPLAEVVKTVDVALVDGTFFSAAELPGRQIDEIGHPLITTTLDLLEDRVAKGELRVYFTHLNHSNPALIPGSPALMEIERRGFTVVSEGEEIPL